MVPKRTVNFWTEIKKSLKITFLDYVIFFIALGGTVLLTLSAQEFSTGSPQLRVEAAGKTYLYSLSQDQDLHFKGPLGESHIEIKGGLAHFLDSPCRDKLCVHTGNLSSVGAWSACLPNRVVARVESAKQDQKEDENTVDGVAW